MVGRPLGADFQFSGCSFSWGCDERDRLKLVKAGSQALAWEPTCLEAPASLDLWIPPDTQDAREAGASVPAFPSWSLGTSEPESLAATALVCAFRP